MNNNLDEYREKEKVVRRIEKDLINLIEVYNGKVGFTGNAVYTVYEDLKHYFSNKFGLKKVTLCYEEGKEVKYENVEDIFLYLDGMDYCGNTIYASICQKSLPNYNGRYYSYIYNKPKEIKIT